MKEDVEFLDNTGAIPIHVWGATLKELKSGSSYTISNLGLKRYQEKAFLSTTFSTVVTPVTVGYDMPEDAALGDNIVITKFSSVVSVTKCKRCKNCNYALDLQAEQNGKIRCSNVQAKCTRAYRSMSLPTVFEVRVSFDGHDGQEMIALFSNNAFNKLMGMSNVEMEQKDMTESDAEDIFLDWDGEIRMVVEGDVVKDVVEVIES